jgi:hypothetical protein
MHPTQKESYLISVGVLRYGMRHHDSIVAKCSLHGISSILREHWNSQFWPRLCATSWHYRQVLASTHGSSLSKRGFDRVEALGAALLPSLRSTSPDLLAVVQTPQIADGNNSEPPAGCSQNSFSPRSPLSKASAWRYEELSLIQAFEVFNNDVQHP